MRRQGLPCTTSRSHSILVFIGVCSYTVADTASALSAQLKGRGVTIFYSTNLSAASFIHHPRAELVFCSSPLHFSSPQDPKPSPRLRHPSGRKRQPKRRTLSVRRRPSLYIYTWNKSPCVFCFSFCIDTQSWQAEVRLHCIT